MTTEEIREILKLHKAWINEEKHGKRATVQCPLYGRNTPDDFCSRGERWRD